MGPSAQEGVKGGRGRFTRRILCPPQPLLARAHALTIVGGARGWVEDRRGKGGVRKGDEGQWRLTLLEVEDVDVVVEARVGLARGPSAAAHDDEETAREARAMVRPRLGVGPANVGHLEPAPRVELEEVQVDKVVARGPGAAEAAEDGHLVLWHLELVLGVKLDQVGRVVGARVRGRAGALLDVPL
jgi:hypothetical protein